LCVRAPRMTMWPRWALLLADMYRELFRVYRNSP
jgi:hypothetical protein